MGFLKISIVGVEEMLGLYFVLQKCVCVCVCERERDTESLQKSLTVCLCISLSGFVKCMA